MLDKLDWADFVLLVCTETYCRRFRGHEQPDIGRGVDWEGQLITLEIYLIGEIITIPLTAWLGRVFGKCCNFAVTSC